jgi:hypothetical protein
VVTANVTDNVGVTEVTLIYFADGQSPPVRAAMGAGTPPAYGGAIQGSQLDVPMGMSTWPVTYFVEARDAAGNVTTSPPQTITAVAC